MKGLKEFIEDLAKDNKLREKFKDLKDVKEIVSLAEKEGYKFTEAEYMDKQIQKLQKRCEEKQSKVFLQNRTMSLG